MFDKRKPNVTHGYGSTTAFVIPPIPFKDASLHWFLSPCKLLSLFLLCWPPGCCFELYRECLRRVFFYCKTCPEHIVSQWDLKDLSNQSQITVHVRVSIPAPQELATGPRLLIAHIPSAWSVVGQPGMRIFCLTPPTAVQTFTHTHTQLQECNNTAPPKQLIGIRFYPIFFSFTDANRRRWIKRKNGEMNVPWLQVLMRLLFVLLACYRDMWRIMSKHMGHANEQM